eukprot:TRINITY_DN13933_c0_g1_i1.p1 TRINITY_DN13933_c0_g1~~TRINITY_DN13933_c0_g1_i1.p1  ORF type:complete len:465 (-),score=57.52 TRINITY_DN13933_c0_g1_i1:51-1445(-)
MAVTLAARVISISCALATVSCLNILDRRALVHTHTDTVAASSPGQCPQDAASLLSRSSAQENCGVSTSWTDLFEEPAGEGAYTVRDDDFNRAVKPRFDFALSRLSERLSALAKDPLAPFTIVVLGNSMTAGHEADFKWSDRLETLLKQKGFKHLKVENYALVGGGTTRDLVERDLRLAYLKAIDVVLVDIAISDSPPCCGLEKDDVSPLTERLIRYLLQLPQQPAVAYLETFTASELYGYSCGVKTSEYPHWNVLTKFKVPTIDYNAAVCPTASSDPHWGGGPHPLAVPTHENIARIVAGFLIKETAATCTSRLLVDHPVDALVGEAALCAAKSFEFDASNGKTAFPAESDGSWCFYADRPERPGWIASKGVVGEISFSFKLERPSHVTLRHVVSYENMGSISCRVDDASESEALEINGLNKESKHSYFGSATFDTLIAAGAHRITCKSKGEKFKIVGMSACSD